MQKIMPLLLLSLLFSTLSSGLNAQQKFSPAIGVTGALDNIPLLIRNGCTFIQPSVSAYLMPNESEESFEQQLKKYEHAGIDIFACNSFIPGDLKSVGPEQNEKALLDYAENVFRRAQKAGVEVIVFGSGASRRIPEGFSPKKARKQFIALGRKMALLAEKYSVTICLENLNATETNLANTFGEAFRIAREIDHPNFRLTVDIYHMLMEDESPGIIHRAAPYIYHCDLAEEQDRRAPGVSGEDFRPYFRALKAIGYEGKIAIECRWEDMKKELPVAVKSVREQLTDL